MAVQDHVKQTLGAKFTELNTKYKALSDRIDKKQDTALDFPEVVAAYRDLASTYVEAKRAQVRRCPYLPCHCTLWTPSQIGFVPSPQG
jgi:hypothetical protein